MDIYFYYVDEKYIDFLKKSEKQARGFTRVPDVKYWNTDKFVFGAVLEVEGLKYFVPVTSYSKKQQDLILIRDKKDANSILGSLRFTYMIPVPPALCKKMDINALETPKAIAHTSKELAFCRRNRDKIFQQARKTYQRVITGVDENLVKNSCAFRILEAACREYCQKNAIILGDMSPDKQSVNNLEVENAALKKALVETTEISEKRAITIRTTNAVLSANPELKRAFVDEKRKLLQQPTTSQKKPSPPVQPQQPKKSSKPKH